MSSRPDMAAPAPLPTSGWTPGSAAQVGFALAVLAFMGNYLHVGDFGIYEDDYPLLNPHYSMSAGEVWAAMKDCLHYWPLGRPVGYALNALVSWTNGFFDSLTPAYLLAFALQWVNAALFFGLAARLVPAPAAFAAAAIYALYPADAGKQMLQGRVFNSLNATVLLAALHLHVRGRKLAAHATATVTLLIYEFFYFPFVMAPLLTTPRRPIRWRGLVSHLAACAGIAASVLVVRWLRGDSRASEVLGSPGETLARLAKASLIGPWTALSALVRRPVEGLFLATGVELFAVVLVAAGTFLFLSRLHAGTEACDQTPRPLAPLVLAGALGLVGAYVVAFRPGYYPPILTVGRMSGFHSAGAAGACLLVAAGLTFALERLGPRRRALWTAAAALILAGLVSFGIEIQRREYVQGWRQQREVWSTVLATSGEWKPTTMLVVDMEAGDVRERETEGFAHHWILYNAQFGVRQFVELPPELKLSGVGSDWQRPPTVVGFSRSYGARPAEGGVRLLGPENEAASPVIHDREFILFRFTPGGRLVRVDDRLDTGAGVLRPVPTPREPPPPLPTTRLYQALTYAPAAWPSARRQRDAP